MWNGEAGRRLRAYIWLKAVGSTVAISGFFAAYFIVLNNPLFPVRVMPVLGFDTWLPVVEGSAWVYFSLWVYICLPSALMRTPQALGHYLLGAAVLSLLALGVFLLLPTAVPEPDIDWAAYPLLGFLKEADAAGNACPSLHAGFAMFSGLWLGRMLQRVRAGAVLQVANGGWCVAILVSTVTTRQHVVLDVVAGVLLGAFVYGLNRAWTVRRGVEL